LFLHTSRRTLLAGAGKLVLEHVAAVYCRFGGGACTGGPIQFRKAPAHDEFAYVLDKRAVSSPGVVQRSMALESWKKGAAR